MILTLPAFHERWVYFSTGQATVMLNPPENTESGGTGFQIQTSQGPRVVTNAHICEGSKALLARNFWEVAKVDVLVVLKVDLEKDLCMLQAFPAVGVLTLAGSPSLPLDVVYVVGHPALEALTISRGRNRGQLRIRLGPFGAKKMFDSVSTSAKVYGGNSGSPVLNSYGNVVGVLFAANPRTSNGYFVPWRHLQSFILNTR